MGGLSAATKPSIQISLALFVAEVPLVFSHVLPRAAARSGLAGSVSPARQSRRPTILLRAPALVASGILVGGLTLGSVLAVQAPSGGSDDPALRPGAASLVDRGDLAPGLSELRFASSDATTAPGANRLLALGPDGAVAAVASQIGPDPATLALVHVGGAQQQVSMPGLIGAGFAPDGRWLAVIDGSGSMWRVPADGSAPRHLVDGPFLGQPIVEVDGSIVTLHVSSVEAPIQSRLVRIGPDNSITTLADEELVYGAQLMPDGSLAYAAHRESRLVMMRIVGGNAQQLADLGQDAVHAQLSPQADAIAFERAGDAFVLPLGGGDATFLAHGSRPQFAPDGRTLLVEQAQGAILYGRGGGALGALASQAGFAPCVAECRP